MEESGVEYWRTTNKQGYQKYISRRSNLHNQSRETLGFMISLGLIKDNISVYEAGCGCGRNLYYIYRTNKTIKIAGNDLDKEQCFKYIDKLIAKKINFYESDTESMFRDNRVQCDILLFSDHLMHLYPDSVATILDNTAKKWKPKNIVMRERTEGRLDRLPYIHAHDYSVICPPYRLLKEQPSQIDKTYRLTAYEMTT